MLPVPDRYDTDAMRGQPLLLHTCCGPCACGCVPQLLQLERRITLFFSNSNLNTREEYELRLRQVERVALHWHLELITDEYRHDEWLAFVAQVPGYDTCPERGLRCGQCFRWQLRRTAEKADLLDCGFTTTLTVSPYKNSATIFEIGSAWDRFEAWNFKKGGGYAQSQQISRELELYRQNYCGCEFSFAARLQP